MSPRRGIKIDEYRRLAAEGYSQSETARMLRVKPQTVKKVANKNAIVFVKGYKSKEKRDAEKAAGSAGA